MASFQKHIYQKSKYKYEEEEVVEQNSPSEHRGDRSRGDHSECTNKARKDRSSHQCIVTNLNHV